jgi:hypothetical protein
LSELYFEFYFVVSIGSSIIIVVSLTSRFAAMLSKDPMQKSATPLQPGHDPPPVT